MKRVAILLCLMLTGCDIPQRVDHRLAQFDGWFSLRVATSGHAEPIRMEGDSMAAGMSYDPATETATTVYCWPFPSHGIPGAPLEVIRQQMSPTKAETLILFAGFNNLKRGESVEHVAGLYAALVARARTVASHVSCIGVPPIDHAKADSWFPQGRTLTVEQIRAFNERIATMCDSFVDTHSLWRSDFSDDGVHPNERGYAAIMASADRTTARLRGGNS